MIRLAAALTLALAGCSPPALTRAPHPAHPAILSINPCSDAILAAVADRAQIAGLSAYSSDPAQSSMDVGYARTLPATRGTVEEAVLLHPDVVVAGGMVSPATRAALTRLGLPLAETGIAHNVAESEAQVMQLARLAGHADRGAQLNAAIEASLASAAPARAANPIRALVWQSGGMVPGTGTLIADLLARTGFASHSAALGMRQADVLPLETVLARPPQVILAAGNAHSDPALAHPVLAGLRGVKRYAFAPALEWCGGPTIIRVAARLAQIRADYTRRAVR